MHRANARIQLTPAAVAVGGERECALYGAGLRILDADDSGIARAGPASVFVRTDVSYCSVIQRLESDRRRRQQLHEIRGEIRAFGANANHLFSVSMRGAGAAMERL